MNFKDLFAGKPKEIGAIEAKVNQAVKNGEEYSQALTSLNDDEIKAYREYVFSSWLKDNSEGNEKKHDLVGMLYEIEKNREAQKLDWDAFTLKDVKIEIVPNFSENGSKDDGSLVSESYYLYLSKFRLYSKPLDTLKKEDGDKGEYLEEYLNKGKRVELQDLGDIGKTLKKAFVERDVNASHLIFNYLAQQKLKEEVAKDIEINKTKEKIRTRLKKSDGVSGVAMVDKIVEVTNGKGSGTPEKGRVLAKQIRQGR